MSYTSRGPRANKRGPFRSIVKHGKFAHYLRRAGLIGFQLHSLRHSFATILISRGVDLYTVSRLLGNSDIRTSMIYAKARMDTLQEAVDRLELVQERYK